MSVESFRTCFAASGWSALETWLADNDLPFLFERSIRVSASAVETRRGLLSVPTSVLRQQQVSAHEVLQICRQMSSPESHLRAIDRFLPSAGCVHFGFEASGTDRIGKCYLERPAAAAEQLVFLGFKWSVSDERMAVVSRYRAVEIRDQPSLMARLLQHVPTADHAAAGPLIEACVCAQITPQQLAEVRLLEVTEEGSERRSLDLNIYERSLTLADVIAPCVNFARHLQADSDRLSDWMTQQADCAVGHLSLGTDRAGCPFFTLYHAADIRDTVHC